jgi:DNA-binding CsgD family transcriptional regulator
MPATDDAGRERSIAAGLAIVFALVAALAAIDLASDLGQGTSLRHALVEGGTIAIGLAGAVWMAARHRALAREARALARRADELASRASELDARLATSHREAERWRAEARDLIRGLGEAIDRQLEAWSLSPAEKEIALLLLKGLSHKEVAELRGVSEATVRQQARSIYRKAGLEGRHDLAAFFLEDLLGPATGAPGA